MKVVFTGKLRIKDEGMPGQWIGVADPEDHFMWVLVCPHDCLRPLVGKDVKVTVEVNE